MKSLRPALLCAALAGALSASAAEPSVTIRTKSVGDFFAAVREGATLAGQPFAAVMAESQFRSMLAQTGLELRDDAPILFALSPKAGAPAGAAMLADPPPMGLAVPAGPLPAEMLETVFGATNAPAAGEWLAAEESPLAYSPREGLALFAVTEEGRALAEALASYEPLRPDALFEISADDPAELQKRLELGDLSDAAMSEAFDAIADALGLPGAGDRIKALADAAEKTDAETERFVADIWFDATNGFVCAASRIAREGTEFARRIAAAPALDPAALPGVPAGAPFWGAASSGDSPEADSARMIAAFRALFEGPAPSGDAAATAQRAAAVRLFDAAAAALPAQRGGVLYVAPDAQGRPALVGEYRLADAAAARAALDAQADFLAAFPNLASNGVAFAREPSGAVRVDVSTADALVSLARFGWQLQQLEEEDPEDLWTDDEEEEDGEDAADGEDDAAETHDPEAFDEAEARSTSAEIAKAVGETLVLRSAVAADGSSERTVLSVEGAEVPAAAGAPDLAPALALGGAYLPKGARPVGACGFSARAAVAAFLPRLAAFFEACDEPIDEESMAKLKGFAEGEADFRFRALSAADGRALRIVFAIPGEDIAAAAKFFSEMEKSSGDEAEFDFEDNAEDDAAEAEDDAA